MKTCSKCKETKELEEFHKNKSAHKGVQTFCKSCKKTYNKEYLEKNKKKLQEYFKSTATKAQRKLYYTENKEKILKQTKTYYNENKTKLNKKAAEYRFRRYHSDLQFKLTCVLRDRVSSVLKGTSKGGSAVKDLGCSMEELKKHLESQFKPGMTWENYGLKGWHIDHIIPLKHFDLTDREQFLKACHYTNLQPLWAKENISKGSKIITFLEN